MSEEQIAPSVRDPLLSVPRVARIFDVTPYTVRVWLKDGDLKGTKLPNGHWKVLESEVARFANTRYGSK